MFILGGALAALGILKLPSIGLSGDRMIIGWLVLATVVGQCVLAGFLARLLREKEPIFSIFTLWGALGTTVFCWVVYGLNNMTAGKFHTLGLTPAEVYLLTMMGVSFQLTCILLGLVWPKPELEAEEKDAEFGSDGAVDDEAVGDEDDSKEVE
tara:strand:+ start:114 stop:572 length:459 start_codon:yes stop_codon:yes gene_type:complete